MVCQQQQRRAARQHADLVAGHLHGVGEPTPVRGDKAHRQAVGHYVLGGHQQIDGGDQYHHRNQCARRRCQAENAEAGQQHRGGQLQCDDPSQGRCSRHLAFHQRRPDRLEYPGQGEQFERADPHQFNTRLAPENRQGMGKQPGRQALGQVQRQQRG